jgi:hypothetical protein
MRPGAALLFVGLTVLGGCATKPMPRPGEQSGVDRAMGQPFRDLSLIREVAPEPLQRAAAGPYDTDRIGDCAAAQAEVAELNDALGPDLSADAKTDGLSVQGLAGDLVAGAFGLPFRGVVRFVTGAEDRDQALRAAVLAGMVRRGFLKGRMGMSGCALPPEARPVADHSSGERAAQSRPR